MKDILAAIRLLIEGRHYDEAVAVLSLAEQNGEHKPRRQRPSQAA